MGTDTERTAASIVVISLDTGTSTQKLERDVTGDEETKMLYFPCFLLVTGLMSTTTYAGNPCSEKLVPDDGLHEICSHRHLTSVPVSWPGEVVWLDLSYNELSELSALSQPALSSVRHLDLSHNALKDLNQHAFDGMSALRYLDLSYNQLQVVNNFTFIHLSQLDSLRLDRNQLTSLSDNAFRGLSHLRVLQISDNQLTHISAATFKEPIHLTRLDLSNNKLQALRNGTFSELADLEWLSVGNNRLHRLETDAFVGLSNLTQLHLRYNNLQLQHSSLPPHVFAPLVRLQELVIDNNDNSPIGDYPLGVFGDLASLKYLSIDTFQEVHFGTEFSKLQSVSTLDLTNNCKIRRLRNDSLEGFKNLSVVSLFVECRLVYIEACSFCDFPYLKHLRLRHNNYLPVNVALKALYGLQHQDMQEIDLSGNGKHNSFYVTLDRDNGRYLNNICVKRVSLKQTNLQRITPSFILNGRMSRCLKDIDASENSINGDKITIVRALSLYTNLTRFQIGIQMWYSLMGANCLLSRSMDCEGIGPGDKRPQVTLVVPTPLQMVYANVSSVYHHFDPPPKYINFTSENHLKTLDISYGFFSHCMTTFFGLQRLETLDIGGNYCYNISDDIFDHLPSLRHLSLSSAHLNPDSFIQRAKRLFQNLERLETLDLSQNGLKEGIDDMLPFQRALKELTLSENSFQRIPVDVSLRPNLTLLDMSYNMLTSLTTSEQQSLDLLASRHIFRQLSVPQTLSFLSLHFPLSLDYRHCINFL